MKKLILTIITLLLMSSGAWGATYNGATYTEVFYLCATGDNSAPEDGTCAHAWNRSGFNTSGNWAAINSDDGKIGPNDAVVMLDDGGNFVSLTVAGSGLAGAPITILAGVGESPVINQATSPVFAFGGKSYISLIGPLTLTGSTSYALYDDSGTGNIVDNVTNTTSGTYGIWLKNANGSTVRNLTGGKGTTAWIRLQTPISVTLSNIANTDATVKEGIWVQGGASSVVTLDGIALSNTTGAAIMINSASGMSIVGSDISISNANTGGLDGGAVMTTDTGTLTNVKLQLRNLTIATSVNAGLRLYNANTTYTTDSYVDGFDISGASSDGISAQNSTNMLIGNGRSYGNGTAGTGCGIKINASPNWRITASEIDANGEDGISMATNSTGTVIDHCKIHDNGATDASGNGDGITAHDGCTGQLYHDNLIYHNANSGLAVVLDSAGSAYNNTIYDNGGRITGNTRGGIYNSGTGAWTINNNIGSSNTPYEINFTAAAYSASTFNYNSYYHPIDGNFATLDGGSHILNWVQYHTSPNTYESGSIYGNPLFTSTTTPDFRLFPTSPAINTGTNLCATLVNSTDYAGNQVCSGGLFVGKGSAPDIGAYEYQSVFGNKGGFNFNRFGTFSFGPVASSGGSGAVTDSYALLLEDGDTLLTEDGDTLDIEY